jgi:DNA-binding NarL/FixJ family response regulator
MKKIKIFLSDPQILFREGIHFILSGEDDFEVNGETTSNEEAFAYIENNTPNIAILSVRDKKISGPDIVRRIKRRFPSVATILTIDKQDDVQILEIMKSGAATYLTKDIDPEHLLDIIRVVSQGSLPIMEEMMRPEMARLLIDEFQDIDVLNERMENLLSGLTTKETQVLSNIVAGNSIEQIISSLSTDEETIRGQLRLVLNKLVTNDQTQAIIMAVQGISAVLASTGKTKKLTDEYLTKEEFTKFKDSLSKRFKSIVGETA